MNSEYTPTSQGKSFYPLLCITISLIIFFGYQLSSISSQQTNIMNVRKQLDDFTAANDPKEADAKTKAEQIENTLSKLANDLYQLATTDPGAKTVVDNLKKIGINYQGAPAASPTPAPSGVP